MADLQWRYSRNAGVVFGAHEPPASIVPSSGGRQLSLPSLPTTVVASIPYNGSVFMNRQAGEQAKRSYMAYLRTMLSLVDLPTSSSTHDGGSEENKDTVRLIGVVTQLNDPHAMQGAERNAPWEFYAVTDPTDDDQLLPILDALSPSRPDVNGTTAAEDDATASYVAGRLSLFCGQVSRFTCMHPGVVVGVVGTPCRRDLEGRLTSVLVKEIVPVSRPLPRWCLGANSSNAQPSPSAAQWPVPARIMYLSGPFPRRAVGDVLTSAVDHAVQRQATLLIIGGPLIVPFDEVSERTILAGQPSTFSDQLEALVSLLEAHLTSLCRSNALAKRLTIVMVPSLDDVTQLPVLPQTQYAVALDDGDGDGGSQVRLASNPCRVVHGPLSIGVLQHDAVSDMRERMIERMQGREEGSLHRVAEAVLTSRLYTPAYEFPNPLVDSKHLLEMMIGAVACCAPAPTATTAASGGADGGGGTDAVDSKQSTAVPSGGGSGAVSDYFDDVPHVVFLPSRKPQFAFTAHARGQDLSEGVGMGALVVNPMQWNHANKRQTFFLNVVEITIPDAAHVAAHGVGHPDSNVAVSVFSAYRE